jgi:hypothetical protein
MTEELDRANADRERAEHLAIKMLAENEMLTSQLRDATIGLDQWMAYATAMETRLDVIVETVQGCQSAARQAARQAKQQPQEEPVRAAQPAPQAAPPDRQIAQIRPVAAKPVPEPAPKTDEEVVRSFAPPESRLPVNELT